MLYGDIGGDSVMPLANFLWKYSMEYTLYLWISLLEPTLETFYKPQTQSRPKIGYFYQVVPSCHMLE